MLQSLDPHSSYMTEEMFKELREEMDANSKGWGLKSRWENGILTIISPIEDSPAFKAGLKPGDKIIKLTGSHKNVTLVSAVKKMRGPKGSKVTLTIMREGFKSSKTSISPEIPYTCVPSRKRCLKQAIPMCA